jgi:hypothetical protein
MTKRAGLKLEGFATLPASERTRAMKKAKEQPALSLVAFPPPPLSNGAANFFHISFHPLVQPLVVCALSLVLSLSLSLDAFKKAFYPR